MKTVGAGDKVHNWLESAKKASVRAQNLTQQLLTFSKGGEPIKKLVSIRELIEESTGFVLVITSYSIHYTKLYDTEILRDFTVSVSQKLLHVGACLKRDQSYNFV